MPLYDVKCRICGAEQIDVFARMNAEIRCACGSETERLWRTHAVIGDDIPGGFVQEHFGHTPEVFYSKQAMLKRADQLGLAPMVKHAGPHDRHVARWVSVDLAAATALVSRSGRAADPPVVCDSADFTVTPV